MRQDDEGHDPMPAQFLQGNSGQCAMVISMCEVKREVKPECAS